MLHNAAWEILTDISEELTVSIITFLITETLNSSETSSIFTRLCGLDTYPSF
jgi:hypothetical protein